MRLICGILHLDGTAATAGPLDAMAAAMVPPGLTPRVDMRVNGPLGLAVVDFNSQGGGLIERDGSIIAADARLDRPGRDPAQMLVDATARYGVDFPDHVDGDVAIAVWRPDRAELLLGRDFMGVRPLSWTWRAGRWFAFASLPKGLHGSGMASPAIDPPAVGARLVQTYFSRTDSGFAEIAYLEAGHSLTIRPDDDRPPRPHRAYRPGPADVGRWRGTPDEAADTLRRLLKDAVAARLPASGPVACHLSGGLDSSAITVLAARDMRQRSAQTLALSMTMRTAVGPAELNERPLIAAVLAQEPQLDHTYIHHRAFMPGDQQDPDWPGSIIGGHDDQMAATAANFGADRILSGVGGDEGASYNGANLYARLLRDGHLRTLWRELPARARTDGRPLPRAILERLIWPLLPKTVRHRIKRRPGPLDLRHGLGRYVNPALIDQVAQRQMPIILQDNSPTERVRAFAEHLIPGRCTYYAIMMARHGLAVSFPLLDRRVVDFMLSLPVHMFLADGQSRQPFRRAMHGILPEDVRLARHKVGQADEMYIHYAAHKAMLLSTVDALRAAPPRLVSEIVDLDAIRAGLNLLPEPGSASTFIREHVGALPGGHPPWLLFAAVQCLVVAGQLAEAESSPAPAG